MPLHPPQNRYFFLHLKLKRKVTEKHTDKKTANTHGISTATKADGTQKYGEIQGPGEGGGPVQ